MESSVCVLETPEPEKSIDEINEANSPQINSNNPGLVLAPQTSSLQEKLEFFKSIYSHEQNQEFNKKSRSKTRSERIKNIESELQSLSNEAELLPKNSQESHESLNELENLAAKLQKIKENSLKVPQNPKKSKLKFPKSTSANEEKLTSGIMLQVEFTKFLEQQKIIDLHNKVADLEKAIGSWENESSISASFSELFFKFMLLNENMLEKTKENARHLGNNLDAMCSNSSQNLASLDIVQVIQRLYDETYIEAVKAKELPVIIEKFRAYQSIFMNSAEVGNEMKHLETSTAGLAAKIDDSLEALKNLKEGIEENSKLNLSRFR